MSAADGIVEPGGKVPNAQLWIPSQEAGGPAGDRFGAACAEICSKESFHIGKSLGARLRLGEHLLK
jgi:hypothetical protein